MLLLLLLLITNIELRDLKSAKVRECLCNIPVDKANGPFSIGLCLSCTLFLCVYLCYKCVTNVLQMWFHGLMMIIKYLVQRALCPGLVWSDELKAMESL